MSETRLQFSAHSLEQVMTGSKSDLMKWCKLRGLPTVGSREKLQIALLKLTGTQVSSANILEMIDENKRGEKVEASNDHEIDDCSDVLSLFTVSNVGELEARSISFMQNMKSILLRRAMDMRFRGEVRNPR